MSHDLFRKFAHRVSEWAGTPITFFIAVSVVICWALLGPFFGFSDTWQLVINTSTTIITFLMIFLVQNTQNRDARAIQIKLDELLHATSGARDALVDLEDMTDAEIEAFHQEFQALRIKRGLAENGEQRAG